MTAGTAAGAARRRLLAPEVVQASAMDCGPAALKCLLDGFGVGVSYERLREVCQTDLDGTSIDTMERVAGELGLLAEQIMIPADHLLLPEARALPAILVVRNLIGVTHFVVAWRRHGGWVQVMDPAAGRRWVSVRHLLADVHHHALPVAAGAWREWAGSAEFLDPLAARMRGLGVGATTRAQLVELAAADAGWRPLAALDAAVRMAAALVADRSLWKGQQAEALVHAAFASECERPLGGQPVVPARYWSVAQEAPAADSATLTLLGAVLVRVVQGPLAAAAPAVERPVEPTAGSLAAAAGIDAAFSPLRELLRLLREDGWLKPATLALASGAAALAVVLEAMLFRAVLDVGAKLGLAEQRFGALAAFLVFLIVATALEWSAFSGFLALGRNLELRLRIAVSRRMAELGEPYFRSRLSADLAERSHTLYRLRLLPELGGNVLRTGFQLLFTAAGIAWLDPGVAPLALLSAALACFLPAAFQPILRERDLRVRSHAGALGRFYLDALLGLVPLRNHGAERALKREHESVLVEWARSALRLERTNVLLDFLQASAGYGLTVWIVVRHLQGDPEDVAHVFLLTFWAIHLVIMGQQLNIAARQVPLLRSTAVRLLEPLSLRELIAPTAESSHSAPAAPLSPTAARGAALRFAGVRVVNSGHVVLDDIDLTVAPGRHVAIVGPSGAGKSTLVGLLMGWSRAAAGCVSVDGLPLDERGIEQLRAQTAWVDPAVQLWNAPLLANLLYGSRGAEHLVGKAAAVGMLRPLVEELPAGLQTPLGEGGGLVSGGEGQRVRFARGLLRPEARLVVLDEPFRGLDRAARQELLKRATSWWPEATILCVTHDIEQTRAFDQVVVMEGGRILHDDSPAALSRSAAPRYRQLLQREARIRRRLADRSVWRQLRLEAGRLVEDRNEERSEA